MNLRGIANPIKILLVEDSKSDAAILQNMLALGDQKISFETTHATHLMDAIGLLHECSFDVVLLDLNLPESGGLETLHLISPHCSRIPLIVLTSLGSEEIGIRAVEAGAQDYICKNHLEAYWIIHAICYSISRFKLLLRLRDTEEVLDRETRAAWSANQAKSDFLATVSHEIRSPISAIAMATEILLCSEEPPSKDQSDFLGIIARSGGHLLNLVNDLLDFAKMEAGKLSIESLLVSPLELIEESIGMARPLGGKKMLEIRFHAVNTLPAAIRTDPTRFRQIIGNLLSNAIKFTNAGFIDVRGSLEHAGGTSFIKVSVSDTGCGLSKEQQANLFRPYVQGGVDTSRRYGGTGLGLVLARNLARALGGDVVLESSAHGKGATFAMTVAADLSVFIDKVGTDVDSRFSFMPSQSFLQNDLSTGALAGTF